MIRRCDYEFKCRICDTWLINQCCKTCKLKYPKCKYYYRRLLSPVEFQKYAAKYNFITISCEYPWCKKHDEPIRHVVGNNKFYKKGLLCNEEY